MDFGIRTKMTKWLNPDATTADLGEGMQAYFDKEKKVWVFPGEDPAEKAKPIAPPPTLAAAESTKKPPGGSPKEPVPMDPLAAMMAPPRRTPMRRAGSMPVSMPSSNSGRSRVPGMPPPVSMNSTNASLSAGAPPQFAVFNPKPKPKEKKKEDSSE